MSLKREAINLGGCGRNCENKMSRISKHNLDRIIDKRRRAQSKKIISQELNK
jgi:hypothetical protein